MSTHPSNRFPAARRRGSVLIVALLFSLIIAISLVSFLDLANNATKISYRTYYSGVAMNIAETGLEQGMWEINNSAGTWTNWTAPASGASGAHIRTFDLGTVDGGATTVVKVYAQEKVGTTSAWIVARAIVTPLQGSTIEKWIKITLDSRSLGGVGGVGKNGITSSGNQVDMGSWNSDPDNNPATPPVAYSASTKDDKMSLATLSLDATLSGGNADINGKAAVGGTSTSLISVGPNGYIGPFGTANGTKDPNSISANFSADIPVPSAPSDKTYTSLGSISSALTLPRAGDTAQNGVYYYNASSIDLNGDALVVSPGAVVVLNVTQNSGTAVSVGGNGGAIKVAATLVTNTSTNVQTYSTGKLSLYTSGDFKVSGQGSVINEIAAQLYTPATSTSTTTSTAITNSGITTVYGNGNKAQGKPMETIIGWDYTQTITITTTVTTNGTTTTTTNTPIISAIRRLISKGDTQPVAGTTTTTSTTNSSTPASTTNTATQVGQADNLHIYGTRTDADKKTYGAQDFSISGNGNLSAVVDAPNADISATGGGNSGFIYGSLIGNTLKFTGNDCFYYDESLSNSTAVSRLGIDSWNEMVSYADRATYASYMNF